MSKTLSKGEIREILDESEDGLDFDDDDDVDDPNYNEELVHADFDEAVENILEDIENENMELCADPSNDVPPILNLVLEEHQLRFTGNTSLPDDIKIIETPIEYFLYLFPKELIKFIANETNFYVVQKDVNDPFRVSEMDIQQFIGVVYMMSLVQLPNVPSHWSKIGTSMIQEAMPLKKFENLRRRIHFNDNSKNLPSTDKNVDRMYKIRPILDELSKNFAKVPLEQHLCVDEQICSTKARNLLKRYLPNKPHK
ncbi:piggyBac transposable element-derived protein 4-like [Bactrocera neohumeralis]|uniref:piggyBac transposable element-derived protein 4-like n=1 Tax=Bactrocera neohumeralis TaxID=98809 RepID=UPI00216671EC|nr:piggyBac transposable element-derived protein 4-like [Bactrocera neohumeralis]